MILVQVGQFTVGLLIVRSDGRVTFVFASREIILDENFVYSIIQQ